MLHTNQHIHTLAANGAALVIELSKEDRLPRILHWGADPGDVPAAPFGHSALPLLPVQHEGWQGRPAITGDRFPHLRFRLTAPATLIAAPAIETTPSATTDEATPGDGDGAGFRTPGARRVSDSRAGGSLAWHAVDETGGVSVAAEIVMTPQGIVKIRYTATNTAETLWTLAALKALLPIPEEASEVLDFTGRWALERMPQRAPLNFGTHVRENRRGRTGHDSTTVLAVGTQGFTNRTGQVWAAHVGWSGNHEHSAEKLPDTTAALGGGELLQPGEIALAQGESYTTPWVYFAYSAQGLDGIREKFHSYIRSRPQHPRTPRPVVLNTWEAVYFNHDLGKLKALATKAADVGVERFVLDDGWFRYRRSDNAGLGDWYADETVWPDGLHPISDHVHALGMQFGLWFEPEMVNPDSDLYRAHPDWVLAHENRLPAESRNQHTLDLANPQVFAYLLDRLSTMVTEADVDFIKWDHNRDLTEPTQVHHQTQAVYRLFAQLKQRHPDLEIESCSSGGARIDLGVLEHTDRVWTSDTNDPLDRQQIQLWTGLLLPLELMGAHVGPDRTHITGRVTSLEMRCATALFGHAGLEWDLTSCPPEDLARIREWITLYKRVRPLLHEGTVVVPDRADPSSVVLGVVSSTKDHALFSYAQLTSTVANTPLAPAPMRLRLPGLAPASAYQVKVVLEPRGGGLVPADIDLGDGVFPGRVLEIVGLPVRRLNPADAVVLEIRKVDA